MAPSHPSVTVSQGPPGLAEPVGGLQGHPEFSATNEPPTPSPACHVTLCPPSSSPVPFLTPLPTPLKDKKRNEERERVFHSCSFFLLPLPPLLSKKQTNKDRRRAKPTGIKRQIFVLTSSFILLIASLFFSMFLYFSLCIPFSVCAYSFCIVIFLPILLTYICPYERFVAGVLLTDYF